MTKSAPILPEVARTSSITPFNEISKDGSVSDRNLNSQIPVYGNSKAKTIFSLRYNHEDHTYVKTVVKEKKK